MENKLYSVKNIEELKKVGSIDEIKETIEHTITPIKITVSSYEELYKYVIILRNKWLDLQSDTFFKNEQLKYLFCLTQLDGEKRNKFIGLSDNLYDNKTCAVKWYKSIVKILQTDVNTDELTNNAFNELNRLYSVIIKSFDEDE